MSTLGDRPELRELLAEEVADACDVIEAAVLATEAGGEPTELSGALRAAHSAKGAAGTLGVAAVAQVTHELETLFAELGEGRCPVTPAVITGSLRAVDELRASVPAVRGGRPLPRTLVRVASDLRALTSVDIAPAEPVRPSAVDGPPPSRSEDEGATSRGAGAEPSPEGTVRVAAARLQQLVTASGQLVAVRQLVSDHVRDIRTLRSSAQQAVDDHRRGRLRRDDRHRGWTTPEEVSSRVEQLDDRARRIERLTTQVAAELQETALATALLPFTESTAGLARVVRDTAAVEGVEVRLELTGTELEVDRRVVTALRDPLIHLLRNAVVHGIEAPEERAARGKDRIGELRVEVVREGGDVVVRVSDDGAGIDVAALRRAVTPDEPAPGEPPTDEPADDPVTDEPAPDDLELLFVPGLSTAGAVTEHAGRGVGMDIVRRGVESIGGRVVVASTRGGGTEVMLRAPITLSTMRVLLVGAGDETVAVLAGPVERVVGIGPDDLVTVGDRPALRGGTRPVTLVTLRAAFPGSAAEAASGARALVLTNGEGQLALRVDRVEGDRDVLVSPLGPRLEGAEGLLGTTVLPDGRRVVVLHPLAAARRALDRTPAGQGAAAPEARPRRRVLVVEDTPTTRVLERNLLETAGYETVALADGNEALAFLAEQDVDLVVTDVDMPNLDGIELCAALRRSPRWQNLPVVLVTSLDTEHDRRRGMEAGADAYIVKTDFDSDRFLRTVADLL